MKPFDRVARPADGAAWITGASAGIGRATALRLAADGWTLYATARRHEALQRLGWRGGGRARAHRAAARRRHRSRGDAAGGRDHRRSGPLALAVLNAGVYAPMRAQNFRAATARRMFEVNLSGVANGLEPVLAHMIARRSGHVAVVASVAGYRGLPDSAAYSATKAGLIAMAEALAMDLVDLEVRISVINPGFVETEATAVNEFAMPFLMTPDEAARRIVGGLKRPGFEIAFPRRFALAMRLVGLLPNQAYIAAVRWMTGWGNKA